MISIEPVLAWPLVASAVLVALSVLAYVALRWRRYGPSTWLARAGVVVLLGLIALGPHVGSDAVTYRARPPAQVVVAIDRTASMAVSDTPVGSRIAQVGADFAALVGDLEAPVTLVSWGRGARVVVPSTTDTDFLRRTLTGLGTEPPVEGGGSRVDKPLAVLTKVLDDAAASRPDGEVFLVVVSDGENTASGTPRSYEVLANAVHGGVVLGYGSARGGPVPLDPETGRGVVPAPDGSGPAVSRRDDSSLASVADQLGVGYRQREELGDLAELATLLRPELRTLAGPARPQDVTWVVGLLVLLLLLPELRRISRTAREAWTLGGPS